MRPPPRPCVIDTFVPRASRSLVSSCCTSGSVVVPLARGFVAVVPSFSVATRPSVCLTDSERATTVARNVVWRAWPSSPASARAWPPLMEPLTTAVCTSGATSRRRRLLVTEGRERPTRSPTCSCVSPNSSISRRSPSASSMALRSERWMFSTSASESRSCSLAVRTTAGMDPRPACRAARSLRSPAMRM